MKKNIVVIDDDEDILLVVIRILSVSGYEVHTSTHSGLIDSFKNDFPDLILLDVNLGDKNGGDICKYLKSRKETADIPVILFSSIPDLERFSKENNANDYLAKPFDIKDLVSKVDKHLNAA